MKLKIVLLAAAVAGLMGSGAMAAPIAAPGTEGFKVIAVGGEVKATYEGTTAAFTNYLYLENTGAFLFHNQLDPVGKTINLGTFAAGTELVFRLFVTNTGYDFFTGPADRNPDGHAHARVESNWMTTGTTLVSFEDLFNGDFTYNDLSFSFDNTVGAPPTVPVPAAFGLLAGALGGLGLLRRRKA